MNARNDAYRFLAAIYDPLTIPFLDPVRRALSRILAQSRPGRVLDLCCGTGRLCHFLQPISPIVVGLDLSPAMLGVARRKSPPGINYLLADAAAPPLRAESFDAVILSLSLHEKRAETRQEVLQAGCRLIRSGGLLFLLELNRPSPSLKSRLVHTLVHGVERSAGREHFACFRDFLDRGGIPGLLKLVPEIVPLERRSFRSGNLSLLVGRRHNRQPVSSGTAA